MSRILLDTHLLLWAVSEPRKLPAEARRWIDEAEVFVSAASIWEVSIKAALGKLAADSSQLLAEIEPAGFQLLPVTGHHAAAVALLPPSTVIFSTECSSRRPRRSRSCCSRTMPRSPRTATA